MHKRKRGTAAAAGSDDDAPPTAKPESNASAVGAGSGSAAAIAVPPLLPPLSGLPLLPAVDAPSVSDLAAVAAAAAARHNLSATGLDDPYGALDASNGGGPKHWLKVQPQPPRFPFVNVFFPITVFLVDSKDVMKTGVSAKLQIDILYENGEPVPDQSILQINSDNVQPRIDHTGTVEMQLAIKQVSMNHENRSFFLRFSSDEKNSAGPISPVTTTLMTVVRHRIKVTTQPPPVWYKDEGGRDKAIAVNAVLVDENDQPVRNREAPLKVVLLYEGDTEVEVKNQGILKISNDHPPKIDRQGKIALRVRIEEVSKNHQKQSFVIRVGPDPAYNPGNCDISSDISTAVTVRSKRNKRRKTGEEITTTSAGTGSGAGAGSAAAAAGKPKSSTGPASNTSALAQSLAKKQIAGRTGAGTGTGIGSNVVSRPTVATPVTSTPTVATPTASLHHTHHSNPHTTSFHLRPGSAAHQAALQAAAMAAGVMLHAHQPNALPLPPPSTPTDSIGVDSKELQWLASGGGGSFGAAVHGVISWSQFVVKSLQDMEWQQVGWLEVSDEQPHRPLHRCPACWAYKDNIRPGIHQSSCSLLMGLQSYKSVSSLLQDLIKHVNARAGHTQPASDLNVFHTLPGSPTSSGSSGVSTHSSGTGAGGGGGGGSGVGVPAFPAYPGISVSNIALPSDSSLHQSVPLTTGVSVLAAHHHSQSHSAMQPPPQPHVPPPLPGGSPTAGDVSMMPPPPGGGRPSYRVSLPGSSVGLNSVLMSPPLNTPTVTAHMNLSVPLPLHSSSSVANSAGGGGGGGGGSHASDRDVIMGGAGSGGGGGGSSGGGVSANPLDLISAVAVDEKEKHTTQARLERQKSQNSLSDAVSGLDSYYLNAASSTALEPGSKSSSSDAVAGLGTASTAVSGNSDPAAAEENCVHTVMVIQTEFGFPTFNHAHSLSGFYTNENGNYLAFTSLTALTAANPAFTDAKAKDIQSQYDAMRMAPPAPVSSVGPGTGGATPGISAGGGGSSGKAINKLISRADAVTLDHLREQAILVHFQNQAQQTATNFLSES